MFPDEIVKNVYDKYEVIKCFLYHNLTDTDSTLLFFIFIRKLSCSIDKEKANNVIFEILTKSQIIERLDLSDKFWEQFGVLLAAVFSLTLNEFKVKMKHLMQRRL